MADPHASPIGSEWRRWDPHVHAPGTLLNDQFRGDWSAYLDRIEQASPAIEALGITDYFCIRGYVLALEHKRQGRLANIKLLFPNVELRLNIETERKKAINLHLLFSPHDADHVQRIERALSALKFSFRESTYSCRVDDFERLGRTIDPKQSDKEAAIRAGANQFKVSLVELKALFKDEKWIRDNCLVAVAGTENDGPSGLQADASFAAVREEIESFADIIFSGQTATRDYWLGNKAGHDRRYIEGKYRALKPCLHGSDAHAPEQVGAPAKNRFCWIKADATFEGLRQAVIEPGERVHIGVEPPDASAPFDRIRSIRVSSASWFNTATIPINPGLVAVIGERGSGKTALADMIASGAKAVVVASDASFLTRAGSLVEGAEVHLEWGDGSRTDSRLAVPDEFSVTDEPGRVRYLSQQFVERLCSADGLGAELLAEIEAVIFQAVDETERFGALSFGELRDARLEPVGHQRSSVLAALARATDQIAEEEGLKSSQAAEQAKLDAHKKKIEAAKAEQASLVPKGQEARAKALAELEAICRQVEEGIQNLKVRRQKLDELAGEVGRTRDAEEPRRASEIRLRYAGTGLTDEDWQSFGMRFIGNVDSIIRREVTEVDRAIKAATDGQPADGRAAQPDLTWPLADLRAARDRVRKEIGIDQQKSRRFAQMKHDVATWESELAQMTKRVLHIQGADARRKLAVQARRDAYAAIFDTLVAEQKVLEELYSPLGAKLKASTTSASKLEFKVIRHVDLKAWVQRGEKLLDLRSAGVFRGQGSLLRVADKELGRAWESGGAAEVAAAMATFVELHRSDLLAGKPTGSPQGWLRDLGAWLFSTEHVTLEYTIQYDGTDIRRLSPGARGIVLLILYLAVDEWDHRPLVIDQPEENLDPRSVFSELVQFFRAARSRRQVILVTHNANLVVNADVDQVIVASGSRGSPSALPNLSYASGSLENSETRAAVCELLEGGERAFRERERRYRLR